MTPFMLEEVTPQTPDCSCTSRLQQDLEHWIESANNDATEPAAVRVWNCQILIYIVSGVTGVYRSIMILF